MQMITVFCGASSGSRPEYLEAARVLGGLMVSRDIGLVYGGASTGLMGEIANAVMEAGGVAIGVIPESLVHHEVAHPRLTTLHIVRDMHERKALMASLGDAFIAMPGGFGTTEEIFEVATWMQLGLHSKPIGFLNVAGYFDQLLNWLRHGVQEGFVHNVFLEHLLVSDIASDLMDSMVGRTPPPNLFEHRITEMADSFQ